MPVDVQIDETRRWIRVTTTGDLTRDDIAAVLGLRSGDKRTYRLLFDFAEGTRPAETWDELRGISSSLSSFVKRDGPRGPTAIVAHDSASFGMARSYETFCELAGIANVRVFRNVGQAERWLTDVP